jgi:nucleoside-diphosphate-sugar epimerase
MSKKLLLTGATGFIGSHVLRHLNSKKYEISLLVRPRTKPSRMVGFPEKAEIIFVDLGDIPALKRELHKRKFDAIIHIGAIRNRAYAKEEDYLKTNVQATEQLALLAMENDAQFIFFSSIGVFGSIPSELPASNKTPYNGDNHYHESKIKAEALINRYVLYNLKAAVIRPAITYGSGDTGFPYNLIRMISRNRLLLPSPAPTVHLASVELFGIAVQKLLESDFKPGCIYNIADRNPVNLIDLAGFISLEIKGKPFSRKFIIDRRFFRLGYAIAKLFHNQHWSNRFRLFTENWYFDVESAYRDLNLKNVETIPGIRGTIEWYIKSRKSQKD